ncbi:unnamed protein product [Medioppia subpectinata]|uniref:Serpin domain-containing protein n=1 Tax=Medioppia subpectinata TaxID=1979941 RepID=A0A7R9PYZ5_9ACAR|nr:unnamed protein product [Medioppia subpectinata]CAG2106539.1 unnamed protein product [Medioppia subpectinata]
MDNVLQSQTIGQNVSETRDSGSVGHHVNSSATDSQNNCTFGSNTTSQPMAVITESGLNSTNTSFMSEVYPNFLFSPLSITVMLGLLLRASSDNVLQSQTIGQNVSETRDSGSVGHHVNSSSTDSQNNCTLGSNTTSQPMAVITESGLNSTNTSFMSEVYPNFLFSPLSITVMLGLLLRASSGHSYNELYNALELNKSIANVNDFEKSVENTLNYFKPSLNSMANTELEISNGICVRDGTKIITNFLNDSDRYFSAKVKAINFKLGFDKSDQKISKWIENNTKSRLMSDKIRLEPLKEDTNLLLLNTLYLTAVDFHNRLLIKRDFYAFGSRIIKTQFNQRAEIVNITNSPLFKSSFLEIPFDANNNNGKRFSLIIVLPNHNHSLESVEKILFANQHLFTAQLANMSSHLVNVMIPQNFITPECWRLDRLLPHIGIKSIFQSETSLMTKISAVESLHMSRIYHESYLRFKQPLNNNHIIHGSTNTEATGSQKQATIVSDFIANRPFLYIIIERNSSALLLMGRVAII